MMRVLAAVLLLFCFSLRGADMLEETAGILDILEKDYWLSQRNAEGEYRQNTEKRLQKLVNNINAIQRTLQREGKADAADITTSAVLLRGNYGVLKPVTIKRFTLRFQSTSMRNYSREFKRLYKEKEAQAEAAAGEKKADDGRKKGKGKSRKTFVPGPTLANVDLIEYERWLAEICSGNAEKFQNAKNNGSKSEVDKMNNMVGEYFTAVRKLRIGLAKIRQNTKIEFK